VLYMHPAVLDAAAVDIPYAMTGRILSRAGA
jgi:hypothetical protein